MDSIGVLRTRGGLEDIMSTLPTVNAVADLKANVGYVGCSPVFTFSSNVAYTL